MIAQVERRRPFLRPRSLIAELAAPLGASGTVKSLRRAGSELVQRPPLELLIDDNVIQQRNSERRERAPEVDERRRVGLGDGAAACAPSLPRFDYEPVRRALVIRRSQPAL